MQAVVMDRFGGPDVLHLAERPSPEPKAGEVLVRTRCVGVNYEHRNTPHRKYLPAPALLPSHGARCAGEPGEGLMKI
jgi:NADPH2:quinone reductase